MHDTPSFEVRAYNLGLKIVPNVCKALTPEQLAYYENHLSEIPEALRHGFGFPVNTNPENYIRHLWNVSINETDGTKTIASSKLFILTEGFYNATFPTVGKPTVETKAIVLEVIFESTLAQFFGLLQRYRCWQESQVVEFCEKHHDKLKQSGRYTFFKMEGDLVLAIFIDEKDRRWALVEKLPRATVWPSQIKCRFVCRIVSLH